VHNVGTTRTELLAGRLPGKLTPGTVGTIRGMSPESKVDLAREHLTRASTAFEAGDPVVGVTFLHLAAEAAVVALSDRNGIATERQHWRKAEAATELHTRGVHSTDLSPILELLNQARKDAGYEGEDPDFGDWTSESLLSAIEDVVQTAEKATAPVQDEDEDGAKAADTSEDSSP
jgi:hypothetical protein